MARPLEPTYVPEDIVGALARISSRVHIQTHGAANTRSITSEASARLPENLIQRVGVAGHQAGESPTTQLGNWTGPLAHQGVVVSQAFVWPAPRYPVMFPAGGGLVIDGSQSRWSSNEPDENILVFLGNTPLEVDTKSPVIMTSRGLPKGSAVSLTLNGVPFTVSSNGEATLEQTLSYGEAYAFRIETTSGLSPARCALSHAAGIAGGVVRLALECEANPCLPPATPVVDLRGDGMDRVTGASDPNATNLSRSPSPFGDNLAAVVSAADGRYVRLADAALPQGRSERTLSLWLKTTTPKVFGGWGTSKPGRWFTLLPAANGFGLDGFWNNASVTLHGDARANTVDGAWHHLALTYKDGVLAYYKDDSYLGASPIGLYTEGGDLILGRPPLDNPYGAYDFQGAFDAVRVYDRALSHDEIGALANEKSVRCPGVCGACTDSPWECTPGALRCDTPANPPWGASAGRIQVRCSSGGRFTPVGYCDLGCTSDGTCR
jgi:hypothetical protein